jgi:hypothetical protein
MSDDTVRIWNKAVEAYLNVLSQNPPGEAEWNHGNSSKYIRLLLRDFNQVPPEYKYRR